MALGKSGQLSSGLTSCGPGAAVLGTAFPINYGVSGVARIQNAASPPTAPCGVYLDFSTDGTSWVNGPLIGIGDTLANSTSLVPFSIGIGAGGDWSQYRVRFTGNAGQSVAVQVDASTTTGV